MKKYIFIIAVSTLIWSCGGSGGDEPTPPPPAENKAPSTPTLVAPTNNLLCINNSVEFRWNASTDPEGNAITYQIDISKDNQFSTIAHTFYETSTVKTVSLEKGVAYYWRVKATDIKNASSSYTSTNQFYTEGVGQQNHIPFIPVLVKPVLNSTVTETTATLEWTATDVDNDLLKFDVYFGKDKSPALVVENQSGLTYSVNNLESSTYYYWKIVVKDDKGGISIGQVWSFVKD